MISVGRLPQGHKVGVRSDGGGFRGGVAGGGGGLMGNKEIYLYRWGELETNYHRDRA